VGVESVDLHAILNRIARGERRNWELNALTQLSAG
jgi:hypothetical protein